MMDEREEKLKELLKDEFFAKELSTKIEAEDAQKYFAEHGVDFTMDEMKAMGKALNLAAEKGGELSEDELEQVSGGFGGILIVFSLFLATVFFGGLGLAYAGVNW